MTSFLAPNAAVQEFRVPLYVAYNGEISPSTGQEKDIIQVGDDMW